MKTNAEWRKELGLRASPKCCGCCLPAGLCGACVEYNYGSFENFYSPNAKTVWTKEDLNADFT